jgi:SdrD B-like protein
MRVLMVLIALVATPFIASVAQEQSEHGHARKEAPVVRHADAQHKSAKSAKGQDQDCEQHGQHEGEDEGCGAPALLGAISGTVFFDMNYDGVRDPLTEAGIPDWSIMLSGPVTATLLSDASGNYVFPNLTPGTYQVCEAQRYAWLQTAPQGGTCVAGFGYTIVLAGGQVVAGQDFGNVR